MFQLTDVDSQSPDWALPVDFIGGHRLPLLAFSMWDHSTFQRISLPVKSRLLCTDNEKWWENVTKELAPTQFYISVIHANKSQTGTTQESRQIPALCSWMFAERADILRSTNTDRQRHATINEQLHNQCCSVVDWGSARHPACKNTIPAFSKGFHRV